jgi:hypothetical protein
MEWSRWPAAGADLTPDRQPCGPLWPGVADVLDPDRIAVHGGVGEGRNIARSDDGLGEHAAAGILQGNRFRGEWVDGVKDSLSGLVDAEHGFSLATPAGSEGTRC